MNKYIEQLITKYESKALWDIRATSKNKAMIVPVKEWVEVFKTPSNYGYKSAYKRFDSCDLKVQGIATPKYFIYECSPRYNNVCGFVDDVTFISISEFDKTKCSIGISPDYQYVYNVLKNDFNDFHTWTVYTILSQDVSCRDISSYQDFVSRYVGEKNSSLCDRKNIFALVTTILTNHLIDEVDFKSLEWTTYEEVVKDELRADLFYVDINKSYVSNKSNIWLNSGVYY